MILSTIHRNLMQVYEKSYNTCTQLHAYILPLQYSNVCLSREWASLYLDRFHYRTLTYMYAEAFSSPKQTILHKYRNEINIVNQLQLNDSTNVHLPRFMCVITIGHLFTYVKTCERVGRVKDFEQRSRIYNTVRYNAGFFPWTPTTAL